MKNFVFAILIAVIASLGTYQLTGRNIHESKNETAYERVLRTGVLRCGYGLWPPNMFSKDPNTGKFSGAVYDIVEEMAANLHLKIEWTEEAGWQTWIEGLKAHRFDAFCIPIYQNASRGREAGFTAPVFYTGVYAYARQNDNRFDNGLEAVNNTDIRLSTMDGEVTATIAEKFFPKAKVVSLPQLTDVNQMLLNVTTGKADLVFNETAVVNAFNKDNANGLKRVSKEPFLVFADGFPVAIEEDRLLKMLDSALIEMNVTGIIDNILTKNGATRDDFLRVAKPYQ